MNFQIIPAIDLFENKVVRLYKGSYHHIKIYSENPGDIVKEFIDHGLGRIHIVDLNAARNGDVSINKMARNKIIRAAQGKALLEIGGGIREDRVVKEYFEDFHFLILGTVAVKNPQFVEEMLAKYGNKKFIIGVDIKDRYIRISGWEENSKVYYRDFIKKILEWKIEEIIVTDISRDGTLEGPNIDLIKKILQEFTIKVISSGGISNIEDIRALKKMNHPNLSGTILGKAYYENKINLKDLTNL